MKFEYAPIVVICLACFLSCSQQKTIELSLKQQDGYGNFSPSLAGIQPYSQDLNNPWKNTYLKVTGVPQEWANVEYGHIEIDVFQSIYQNYLLGTITKEWYQKIQTSWDWEPDTLALSREPLKTKIALAYCIDSAGIVKMIVDANNNLDFSDDKIFTPVNFSPSKDVNLNSLAKNNSIDVSYERYIDNKKVVSTTPLFIAYMSQMNTLACNFPQYSTTTFKDVKIAICSDGFANLSYQNPTIALVNDSLLESSKFTQENLVSKNEYIEIKEILYKHIEVKNNKLILEKMDLPKSELHSTQIGYKSHPIEGKNIEDQTFVSLSNLKGKYLFLDFWAVWCQPCLQEIPNLKELYEKTDRESFEILGIVGDSPLYALEKIIKTHSITWPHILSTDSNKIKETYGIQEYPTTYLIDPQGVIIAKNLRGKELEEKILELLQE